MSSLVRRTVTLHLLSRSKLHTWRCVITWVSCWFQVIVVYLSRLSLFFSATDSCFLVELHTLRYNGVTAIFTNWCLARDTEYTIAFSQTV